MEQAHFWYISFADEHSFRGAVVVHARGIEDAVARAWALGINPGGEALGLQLPHSVGVPADAINRLLSKGDIDRLIGPGKTIGEYAEGDDAEAARARAILESL